MTLTEAVKDKARTLGFDPRGIAEARPLPRDGARLSAWLAKDKHAGMPGWRGTPTRAPTRARCCRLQERDRAGRQLLAGRQGHVPEGRAKVALYARGRDYHRVLGEAARTLAAWLAEQSGGPGPGLRGHHARAGRAWAERAGLGGSGKNATCSPARTARG